MPGQRRDALARGRVPHLDRVVQRPGDDAPAVGKDGDAQDLKPGRSHTQEKQDTHRHLKPKAKQGNKTRRNVKIETTEQKNEASFDQTSEAQQE